MFLSAGKMTRSPPTPPLPLLLLLCGIAAVVSAVPSGSGSSGPASPKLVVSTSTGPLRGFVERSSRKWLGIPYAEPPTGDRRWRPPVPKKP